MVITATLPQIKAAAKRAGVAKYLSMYKVVGGYDVRQHSAPMGREDAELLDGMFRNSGEVLSLADFRGRICKA